MRLFRGISEVCLRGGKALQGSFAAVAGYFYSGGNAPEKEKKRRAFFSAVKVLLTGKDGTISRSAENTFRYLLEEFDPELNIEKEWRELIALPLISSADLAEALKLAASEDQEHAIRFLLTLAVSIGSGPEKFTFLEEAVRKCGMDMARYEELCKEISETIGRRERILRSGTGVIAALIVLVVFILTATLLRSVIFGLIFAYLLLPLEKYMERSCREKRGLGYWLEMLTSPFKLLIPRKKLHRGKEKLTFREVRNKYQERLITRAVGQTAFVLCTVIVLFLAGLTYITSFWLQGVGASVRNWKIEQQSQHPGESLPAVRIQQLRQKLMALPATKFLLEHLESELSNKEAQKKLINMALQRSGGVFSALLGVVGTISTWIFDLLLTFFFGLLFLMKLAAYKGSGVQTVGREYAVHTILNGKWLPGVQESTIKEAERIVGGVFDRLRIWVRGYLTLMIIDGTVYTILFCFIGVPYFPIFGIIAGCGILLPYIGPIASCLLTLCATWFGGEGGVVQLLLVLCCYLVYSGVVEQFILYPMVIGESLGLTTLETIIVVLLGAVFAGIPGMILALPAASVLKYIVPQIYRCWDLKRSAVE